MGALMIKGQTVSRFSGRPLFLAYRFLKAYPKQHRQTLITYAVFFTLIFFGALAFIGFCIYRGDSEFAKQFLTVVTHVITLVIGLLVGKQSSKRKTDKEKATNLEDAEIMD
jgi:FtsH-binding integral membrane protein